MNLQWFPGHMAKTRRMISENLKLVDVVVELLDARLPLSSRNPEIDKLAGVRPRILVLNKADMADSAATQAWLCWFADQGYTAIAVDSQSGKGFSALGPAVEQVMREKLERDRAKGIQRHSIKLMVVGIPNVGKSSFINRLAGRSAARTGDRPGVTTAKQWIRIAGKYDLLDTPGILWPKFEDQGVARKLAFTGAVKDDILDIEALAAFLLENLSVNYPEAVSERYKIDKSGDGFELLSELGRKRGMLVSGGEVNTERAAITLLDEIRSGKLGKITLEHPGEKND